MTDQEIEALALAHGFKRKLQADGSMDLNPYVFDFARALIAKSKRDPFAYLFVKDNKAEYGMLADGTFPDGEYVIYSRAWVFDEDTEA
jgi:hypothetical protein